MKHLKTCLMLLLITKREKKKIELLKERKQTIMVCFQFSDTSSSVTFHKRFIGLVCDFWHNLVNYFYQTKSQVTLNWLKLFHRMRTLLREKQTIKVRICTVKNKNMRSQIQCLVRWALNAPTDWVTENDVCLYIVSYGNGCESSGCLI